MTNESSGRKEMTRKLKTFVDTFEQSAERYAGPDSRARRQDLGDEKNLRPRLGTARRCRWFRMILSPEKESTMHCDSAQVFAECYPRGPSRQTMRLVGVKTFGGELRRAAQMRATFLRQLLGRTIYRTD